MDSLYIFLLIASSFILTYILLPINIKFSTKFGLLDEPGERKIHKDRMPLSGGISFAITLTAAAFLLSYIFKDTEVSANLKFLSLGSFLITTLGVIDDKYRLTAYHKLVAQLLIIILMYYNGFKIEYLTNPFSSEIELNFLGLPITIVWYLLIINAMNLIDGIDGMSSGIALIVNLTLFLISLKYGNKYLVFLSAVNIGSYAAFLKYNFFPAKIFMGDAGSLLIGFNIASITILSNSQYKGITTMTLLVPLISLFVPLIDTVMAIIRRIRKKKNIFSADKEHFHHKMLEFGFKQSTIAVISYFITFMFALAAFGFSYSSKKLIMGVLLLLTVVTFFIFYTILKRSKK